MTPFQQLLNIIEEEIDYSNCLPPEKVKELNERSEIITKLANHPEELVVLMTELAKNQNDDSAMQAQTITEELENHDTDLSSYSE